MTTTNLHPRRAARQCVLKALFAYQFSKNITIVYFAHDRWDTSWGGEILLYDFAKSRILDGAPPLPNRLVIFPSYLPHRGVQVSRMCPIMRVSIAFQCKFDNTI